MATVMTRKKTLSLVKGRKDRKRSSPKAVIPGRERSSRTRNDDNELSSPALYRLMTWL